MLANVYFKNIVTIQCLRKLFDYNFATYIYYSKLASVTIFGINEINTWEDSCF